MSDHSPGPWQWDRFACLNNDDVVVCEATSIPHEPNARLIAAAPDMLEACQSALQSLQWLIESGAASSEDEDAAFGLETAIEKATGGKA